MSAARAMNETSQKPTDGSALLLLLAYVEAECRRIGATEAAGLAARTALAIEDACGATPPQHGLPGLTH